MIGRPGAGILQMNGQPTAQNNRECGADGDLPGFRNWENPEHVAAARRPLGRRRAEDPALGAADARDAALPLRRAGVDLVPVGLCDQPGGLAPAAAAHPRDPREGRAVPGGAGPVPHRDGRSSPMSCCPPPAGARRRAPSPTPTRTVHLSEKAVEPPGEARADLDIFLDYAPRMDFRRNDGRPLLEWTGPEDAYRAWQECSRGRPCDYTGISYDDLRRESGIQWPRREGETKSQTRLYTDFEFPSHPDYCESYGHDLLTGASVGHDTFSALRPDGKRVAQVGAFHRLARAAGRRLPATADHGAQRLPLPHAHEDRPQRGARPPPRPRCGSSWQRRMPTRAASQRATLSRWSRGAGGWWRRSRIGDIRAGTVFAPFHYGYWDAPPGAEERHPTAANELTAHRVGSRSRSSRCSSPPPCRCESWP